ncbi:cob(I)yrinic acid a,c-diamide adenosyltransferase [bacterium]|nr:cob(I)yrinic acid a,c-diamide adenosyltransferase [bacterium]
MKIYTKTGDRGETGLFKGLRVPKHDLRVEAYGNVDECNAVIGICLLHIQNAEIKTLLSSIQHELFEVGADLATPPQQQNDSRWRIDSEMTANLERAIDHFESQLPALTNFILPGGSLAGAHIHYARTVCRRAERSVSKLAEQQQISPEILRYLNRLSDLLFVVARSENQHTGLPETIWKKRNT